MNRIFTSLLLTAGMAAAQGNQPVVGVPWLGWIFDTEARALRPVTGIPMAAFLGPAVEPELSRAVGSPEGTFALGVAAEGGRLLVVQGSGVMELAGAGLNPSRIVMSVRGRVGALYFEDGNRVQIFEGLPGSGRLTRELTLDGIPGALAVDDAGSTILTSEVGGLYSYRAEKGRHLLLPADEILEAGFFGGSGGDVVAVGGGKITLVRNGQPIELGDLDGLVNPVKAAGSVDGRFVVALLQGGNVVVRDLLSGTNKEVQCYCAATELTRLRGNGVFRLTSIKDGMLWLVNVDGEKPRVTFVVQGARQ